MSNAPDEALPYLDETDRGRMIMTEKFTLDDQPEVSELAAEAGLATQLSPADSAYEPSPSDEEAFVTDIIGKEAEAESEYSKYGATKPNEYPTYNYETSGGKTINIKHDEWGTFWFVEFSPGGQLPVELQGRFTNDVEAKFAVEQYLAKQDN